MKNNLTLTVFIALLFFSACSNEAQQQQLQSQQDQSQSNEGLEILRHKIAAIEKQMYASTHFTDETAHEAVNLYTAFAAQFPAQQNSADYLFKAAELLTKLKKYPQAIEQYAVICTKYPEYAFATESLFLQAYIYDTFIKNEAKAKEIYQKVIVTYPGHKLAQESQTAIKQLGKSDEDLIKEFKSKNKKNDVSVTSPQPISFPSIFYIKASVG